MCTAIQIYGHPHDLQVSIFEEGGKYGFHIARDAGGNHRPLVTAKAVFPTRDEALQDIRTLLEAVCDRVGSIFNESASPATEVQDHHAASGAICLTKKAVDEIVLRLKTDRFVSTRPLPTTR